jgi:putative membrane protein
MPTVLGSLSGASATSRLALLFVPLDQLGSLVVTTLVFALIGIVLFALAFFVIVKIAPFSTRKEIEEDQNTALAILIGSVIIGIALIVSAAVHG